MIDDIPLVISYETNLHTNLNSQMFKNTLEKYNWDFVFIGENEEWIGFKHKIIGYYNFLHTISDNRIVVLSDSRDAVCLRDPTDFIDKIKDIVNEKIIISAECFLHGHINWNEEQILNAINSNNNFFGKEFH